MIRHIIISLILVIMLLSFAVRGEESAREILVEMKPSPKKSEALKKAASSLDAAIVREFCGGKYAVLSLSPGASPMAASRRILGEPGIANAAPVYTRRLFATTPNDPLFCPNQWALHNTGQTIQFQVYPEDPMTTLYCVADADIDAPEAWDITTGSSSVIVAVIDSGFPLGHADLAPNLWRNLNEIAGNGIDDDSNGYIDDVNGYNFSARNENVDDDYGHGSFCSGIIGARGNNSLGICGVNWQVSIMALKPFDAEGTARDPELVEAIEYAVANGARVINASWGDWLYSSVIHSAVRQACEKGVLFVSAAGNDYTDLKERPHYPSAFALPNHLSVGASDWQDRWADFSNFNDRLVDVFAPGYWVYSARPAKYEYASGTSFAAPMVSGIAALLMAKNPAISPAEVRARLISAFEERAGLQGRGFNNGRISAYLALDNRAKDTTPSSSIRDLRIIFAASNGFRLAFTAPGDDAQSGKASLYDIRISDKPITSENILYCERVHNVPKPSAAGALETFYVNERDPDTTWYIRIMVYDEAGNASLSNEATGTTRGRKTLFWDDMENGGAKWSVSGRFELTTESARSGTWCWTDSPYDDYQKNKKHSITTKDPVDLSTAKNPWLSFYHQHIFDKSITKVCDNGQVQISTDGVKFTSIAQYVHIYSPFRRVALNLAPYAGMNKVWVRFYFESDLYTNADGWYIDDVEIYDPDSLVPEPADIVVECKTPFAMTASPYYIETATGNPWLDSVGKAKDHRLHALAKSRYSVIDKLGSTARFTPMFAVEGDYDVYAIWGEYANATNVRYRIAHANGCTDVLVSQDARTNTSQWVKLGRFHFGRGQSAEMGSVTADSSSITGKPNAGAEGRVYSDSIRFSYVPPIYKDNTGVYFRIY